MRWEQGRAVVDALISDGELEFTGVSRVRAHALQAEAHQLLAAAVEAADDLAGAYSAAYDAVCTSLAAILTVQGLSATADGSQYAVYDAVRCQLDPPMGRALRPFAWMLQRRHSPEFPANLDRRAVVHDLGKAADIVDIADKVLQILPAYQ